MSTRAVFTFKDSTNTFHVHKHSDGYPSGALNAIENSLPYAWKLPCFEAREFATAFIAGNKPHCGGGVYLTGTYDDHGDLEYRYEISFNGTDLIVKAYEYRSNEGFNEIFRGNLGSFKRWIDEN